MVDSIEVKIIQLEPMWVACFPAYGAEPEDEAWQKMVTWAKPLGLLDNPEKHRIFGFDTTGMLPPGQNRGYEFWMEVESGFNAGPDVKVTQFGGGKYAVYRIPQVKNPWDTIPAGWKALVLWQEDSAYKMGKAQCLEQHLGGVDVPLAECSMDLYLSIE